MDFTRIIGGLLKLMGNTDGTPIGNTGDALNVSIKDKNGAVAGSPSNPLYVSGAIGPDVQGRVSINAYNQALLVPSGATTNVLQFTVPDDTDWAIERISVSGDNIAQFTVLVNNEPIDLQRSYFGATLNLEFNFFSTSTVGYRLEEGDIITVSVLHTRPTVGNFEGRIQLSKAT